MMISITLNKSMMIVIMSNKSIGGGLRGGISRISSVPWSPSQLKEELGEWKRAWDNHTASHTATLLAHYIWDKLAFFPFCSRCKRRPGIGGRRRQSVKGANLRPHTLHLHTTTLLHTLHLHILHTAYASAHDHTATASHTSTHCICTYCTLHICTQPNCFTHILHIPNTLQLHHTAHNHYYTHLNDTHCITLWITHYSHCICPTCSRVSAVQGCKRCQNQEQQQINTNNNKSSSHFPQMSIKKDAQNQQWQHSDNNNKIYCCIYNPSCRWRTRAQHQQQWLLPQHKQTASAHPADEHKKWC